jgi:hypothetical protein
MVLLNINESSKSHASKIKSEKVIFAPTKNTAKAFTNDAKWQPVYDTL